MKNENESKPTLRSRLANSYSAGKHEWFSHFDQDEDRGAVKPLQINAGDVFQVYLGKYSEADFSVDHSKMKYVIAVRDASEKETQIPVVFCGTYRSYGPAYELAKQSYCVLFPRASDGGPKFCKKTAVYADGSKVMTLTHTNFRNKGKGNPYKGNIGAEFLGDLRKAIIIGLDLQL